MIDRIRIQRFFIIRKENVKYVSNNLKVRSITSRRDKKIYINWIDDTS